MTVLLSLLAVVIWIAISNVLSKVATAFAKAELEGLGAAIMLVNLAFLVTPTFILAYLYLTNLI